MRNAARVVGILCVVLAVLATQAGSPAVDKSERLPAPDVRVLSPDRAVFLMGGQQSLIVVVEATDVTGAGILTTASGVPRFVAPNKNVDLFVNRLIAHGTYSDGRGRTVIQLVSQIPTAKLETGDAMLTPPIDAKHIPEEFKKEGFTVPPQSLLDAADFSFQVEDRAGTKSEVAILYVAVASDFFRGPYLPPPPEPEGKENPKPGTQQEEPMENNGGG